MGRSPQTPCPITIVIEGADPLKLPCPTNHCVCLTGLEPLRDRKAAGGGQKGLDPRKNDEGGGQKGLDPRELSDKNDLSLHKMRRLSEKKALCFRLYYFLTS